MSTSVSFFVSFHIFKGILGCILYIFFFRWSKLWSEIKLKILYGVNILLPINYIYTYIF